MKQALLALALAIVHTACAAETTPSRAHQGVVDLRSWSFGQQGAVTLGGEWSFDWMRFEDGRAPARTPDAYLPPLMWHGRSVQGASLPAEGYATFRLKVLLPAETQHLLLVTSPADSAYRLMVFDARGETLTTFEAGTVGTTRETTRLLARPAQLPIDAADEITLVMQVSNFAVARAGPWLLPILGDRYTLELKGKYERYVELIVVGMLLMMSLHFLTLFFLRRDERAPLWFSLFCSLLAVRTLLVGRYLEEAHPETTLGPLLLRVEYIDLPLLALFFILFFAEIFTIRPSWFVRMSTVTTLGFVALAALTPHPVFTGALFGLQAFLLFGMGCLAASLVIEAVRNRNRLAAVMFVGLVIFTAAVIHDVLAANQVINSSLSAQAIGGICFLIIQSSMLALLNHHMRRGLETASSQLVAQNREMALLNEDLRVQVAVRSRSLAGTLTALLEKPRSAELKPGMIVGKRYQLEQHLGTGGMGMVFSATRLSDQRRVAIKVISSSFAINPTALARLAREAESAAAIDHPNVVRVLDIDLDEQGALFVAMELVEGQNLEEQRSRFGDLAWALPLLPQLLKALRAIHAGGVLHRDLKPSNILIANGAVKVVDFGIARPMRDTPPGGPITVEMTAEQSDEVQLTQAGSILGSPYYMAPELAEGMANSSVASDLFSFGCIAYELICGKRPFDKPLVFEGLDERKNRTAPPLRTLCPHVDEQLAKLIDRCLGPADARPSTEELLAAFSREGGQAAATG